MTVVKESRFTLEALGLRLAPVSLPASRALLRFPEFGMLGVLYNFPGGVLGTGGTNIGAIAALASASSTWLRPGGLVSPGGGLKSRESGMSSKSVDSLPESL